MKTGKKLLALLLAVVMTMSMMTVGAFAEEPVDETQNSVEEPQNPAPETPAEQETPAEETPETPEVPKEEPAEEPIEVNAAKIIHSDGQETTYTDATAAFKALKDGETVQLLADYTASDWGLSTEAKDITIDLNGCNITCTKETTSGYALKVEQKYGSARDNTVIIKNGDPTKQSVLTSYGERIRCKSGNSKFTQKIVIDGEIAFQPYAGGVESSITLGSGAKLAYSKGAADAVANGHFKADESDGAYIYGSVGTAVKADVDGTVELLNDYVGTSELTLCEGTLDLAGHTYEYKYNSEITTSTPAAINASNNDTESMTVKNGKIVTNSYAAALLNANKSLVLDNVVMEAGYGIETNGSAGNINNHLTMKNSSLTVKNSVGVYFPSAGSVEIIDSTIHAVDAGVQMCSGSLHVSGENTSITATGADLRTDKTGDGSIPDGAAISLVNRDYPGGVPTATIENGKFDSKQGAAVSVYTWNGSTSEWDEWEDANLTISGGTFSSDVSKYLADGYVQNANGEVGELDQLAVAEVTTAEGTKKYETLQKAVDAENVESVKLIKDTSENVTISAGKTITLDLNGKTLNGGTVKSKAALTNHGTVVIQDSSGTNAGTIKREDTKETGSYYTIQNEGTMTIQAGTVTNGSGKLPPDWAGSSLIASAVTSGSNAVLNIEGGVIAQDNFIAVKNDEYGGVLNITGGTISSKTQAVQNWATANISGGHLTGEITTWTYNSTNATTTISGGTIEGEIQAVQYGANVTNKPIVKIQQGNNGAVPYVNGTFKVGTQNPYFNPANEAADVSISAGYFTSDPGAYVADGYAAVSNDDARYIYKVVAAEDETPVKPAVKEPEVTTEIQIDDEATKQAIEAAAKSVEVPALGAEAAKVAVSDGEKTAAVDAAVKVLGEDKKDDIIVYTQAYLDIVTTGYEKTGENVSVTMDITPKVQLVASTAKTGDGIVLEGDQKNAVTYGNPEELTISGPTVVTVRLPEATFGDKAVFIKHEASKGTYFYKATAAADGTITFTSHHGFSPFTFSTANEAVAEIGEIGYPTLKAAIDAAKDNDTITLLKDCNETVTISWEISFKLEKAAGVNFTGKIEAGYRYSVSEKDGTYTVTYVGGGSSGGGSSSSSGRYTVKVDSGKHGEVKVSSKRADKGDTITITVDPDKGYVLDELTVTDKDGDTVKVKSKSDTKFTFTMPASDVTVEATFTAEKEETLPFADIPEDFWAVKEITWAYGKGYMNGVSADQFAPGRTVTRQQLWMVLARLAGEKPADMTAARQWAVENGVSDGSNPGGALTRQQMVTILYRYAKLMGYDATGSADLTVFPDHASVADYAKEAMAWSVKNEIVGGTAQGTLNPAGTATRAQFAVILYRFCGNVL